MIPCSLVGIFQHFGGIYCFHIQRQMNQFWKVTEYAVELRDIESRMRQVPSQNQGKIRRDSQPRMLIMKRTSSAKEKLRGFILFGRKSPKKKSISFLQYHSQIIICHLPAIWHGVTQTLKNGLLSYQWQRFTSLTTRISLLRTYILNSEWFH